MTSASLVFKNFNQEFRKAVNELAAIRGVPAPETEARLAFPLVKGFFTVYPEVHARCVARCPSHDDARAFFDYINEDYDEVTPEQFERMKPVFYRIAKTIPINGH